jgi:large subunit ribosomal protein L23
MERTAFDIIIRPVITEKSMAGMEDGKYTFRVDPRATKVDIRHAIERIYGVRVAKVNTLNIKGKPRRQTRFHAGHTPRWKKAIVTLETGQTIDVFDRVEERR